MFNSAMAERKNGCWVLIRVFNNFVPLFFQQAVPVHVGATIPLVALKASNSSDRFLVFARQLQEPLNFSG